MKALRFPIGITTFVLFFYAFSTLVNTPYSIVFALFMLTNVLFIWMVIRILKDGNPSEKAFDDYFYEDFPEKRN